MDLSRIYGRDDRRLVIAADRALSAVVGGNPHPQLTGSEWLIPSIDVVYASVYPFPFFEVERYHAASASYSQRNPTKSVRRHRCIPTMEKYSQSGKPPGRPATSRLSQ